MQIRFFGTLFLFSFFINNASFAQSKLLKTGDAAPSFSLHDQNDSIFNSSDYIGRKILVIYFYPKDESPVCTKESCSFRDSYEDYVKAGAIVVGINAGSVASHKKFQANHQLPFKLLSDPDKTVLKGFGVKNKWMFTGRETFVIDLNGKIAFTFTAFTKGAAHNDAAMQFIRSMSSPAVK
jgi:peroxiredoxin Q/BCP